MKLLSGQIRLSATDLSNHLACRHVTTLDLQVLHGGKTAPDWAAPDLVVIRERGERHEAAYLAYLAEKEKLKVINLKHLGNDEKEIIKDTLKLMEQGAEVIAQGALASGLWLGRPDVLRRVPKPCLKWNWSYEVEDTKLARETKAATILQLSAYSELLEQIQGTQPESMWVVPPSKDFACERYRVAEYAAYYRHLKKRLTHTVERAESPETYPDPVPHCDVCRWFQECNAQRRADDHLSLVAGIRKQHRNQLEEWDTNTMAKLAALPIPLKQKPKQGSREGITRVREQARVQVEGREKQQLVYEPLLPAEPGVGLCRLPEPSPDDLFLDLEGDPFVGESGQQYLFGIAFKSAGSELIYKKRWAFTPAEEKQAFEWLVDEITQRRHANPQMHVFHFGAYEPTTLKHLMGTYATREDETDRLLRAGALIDLHQSFKQAIRASVEEYSLKKIEAFFQFTRKTPLDKSRAAMRYIEHHLELEQSLDNLPPEFRETMEGYNSEDCFSTAALRDWLEGRRTELLQRGENVPRPPEKTGDPSDKLQEKLDRAAALTEQLCQEMPVDSNQRSELQSAQWLLAQLFSWHRREDKRAWQEGYRLAEMTEEDLLDERVALTNLRFVERVDHGKQVPTDRYHFDPHKINIRCDKELYFGDDKFGEVIAIDHANGVVDIKKTKKSADVHPSTVYMWSAPLPTDTQAGALYRLGQFVATNGVDGSGPYRAGRDLLLRRPPRLRDNEKLRQLASEKPENTATRIALALQDSVFAIQGPPGSGKTYTGARMICELVKQGKKIGVTALSHKVIRNLLEAVVAAAQERDLTTVHCLHRETGGEDSEGVAVAKKNNDEAWLALQSGQANVVGGTSWFWSPEQSFEAVDILFIDEAGQMGLADVLAVSQAAKSLVLIGDPQQLERPLKGSHPPGAEKSALEHLLGVHKTIPDDMGFLLPRTWRLHPAICKFTSELFYEDRLDCDVLTHSRILEGHQSLDGAGLWFVPVEHAGNQNSSPEEVEVVAQLVEDLLKPDVNWFYSKGNCRRLREDEILIVAPYNAQVADLSTRLPTIRVGTVDKFQGQEAPVVIYSMTASSPEEAPRGMEFLYSLNRLNVATSRAKTAVIVVGNPRLLEPECRTPRQMQLANALCRFRELATTLEI
jgi:predicted RecB family nuclease